MATRLNDIIAGHLGNASALLLSHRAIADVVEQAIRAYKLELDGHEPISDENFAEIVTEEWANEQRLRMTEELRQIYSDMSQLRDRMRSMFPSLKDPGACSVCGKRFIRGDRVAPLADGSLKCLRCDHGPAEESVSREEVEKEVSDAAWITFQDRQGGA